MKISILLLLTVFSFGCLFQPVDNINNINVHVISKYESFNQLLNKKINKDLPIKLTLKINNLSQIKYVESYNNNSINSYRVVVTVNFSLYEGERLLFSKVLDSHRFIDKKPNSINAKLEKDLLLSMQKDLAHKIFNIIDAYNR